MPRFAVERVASTLPPPAWWQRTRQYTSQSPGVLTFAPPRSPRGTIVLRFLFPFFRTVMRASHAFLPFPLSLVLSSLLGSAVVFFEISVGKRRYVSGCYYPANVCQAMAFSPSMKALIFFGVPTLYVIGAIIFLSYVDKCPCSPVCGLLGIEKKSELTNYLGWLGAGFVSLYLAWVGTHGAAALNKTAKALSKTAEASNKSTESSFKTTEALSETAKASLKTSEASLKTASNNVLSGSRERFGRGLSHFGSKQGSRRIGGAHEMFLSSLEDGMEGHRAAVAGAVCMRIRDETSSEHYMKEHRLSPSSEIRRLLDLMFVGGNEEQRKSIEDFWKGLQADLSGSYLAGCELEGANFKEARLERVCFNRAKLRQARFYGAKLGKACFVLAELEGAAFMGADMKNARFWGAELMDARFQGSILDRAEFVRCSLEYTEFMGARMSYARFLEPRVMNKLQRWYFRGAFHGTRAFRRRYPK